MLDLEVVPEQGLQAEQWEITLGMHFSQAIALVQSHFRVIKTAHVVYNEQAPLNNDLILDLPADGFRLMFDSKLQRLKLIEVYNLKSIRLKYCGTVFNGPEVNPSVEHIDRCFGATRPGSYDKQRQLFALNFRGLTFYFPVDLNCQPHYSHGVGLINLRFPGDSAPVLSKMMLYSGTSPSEAPVPPLPISCFKSHIYLERCEVLRNSAGTKTLGLHLYCFTNSSNILDPSRVTFEKKILFNETLQSVVSKLGTPSRIFYKSDDKMKIHSKDAHKKITTVNSDYFFNYFTLGLDILFDSRDHKITKFILHTNFPGHYDFNSYHRCPFSLRIGRSNSSSVTHITGSTPKIIPTGGGNGNGNGNGNGGKNGNGKGQKSPKVKKNKQNNLQATEINATLLSLSTSPPEITTVTTLNSLNTIENTFMTISFDTLWETVSDFTNSTNMSGCQDRIERPVVLTRSSSNNPFGSSLCYGVQDMIFEVLDNDHMASVTLYQSDL